MAVKESEARLVGEQIHGGAAKCGDDDRILLDAGGGLAVELDELEQVAVHVQGVSIVTAIVKPQPVAAALPEDKFPLMRKFLAIDEPVTDAMGPAGHFFKDHVDGVVWRGVRRGLAKDGVVPAGVGRWKPSRALLLVSVLHHEAHAGLARDIARLP